MGSFGRHCTRSNSRTNVLVSAFPPTIGGSGCKLLSFKDRDEKLSVARASTTPLPEGSATSSGRDESSWAAKRVERSDKHTTTKPALEKKRARIIMEFPRSKSSQHSAFSVKPRGVEEVGMPRAEC